jgi:hypothetical protein
VEGIERTTETESDECKTIKDNNTGEYEHADKEIREENKDKISDIQNDIKGDEGEEEYTTKKAKGTDEEEENKNVGLEHSFEANDLNEVSKNEYERKW